MTEVIVSPTELLGKSHADLICPQPGCRALCTFSSSAQQVRCAACGWQHELTNAEHDELLDAILGITMLDVPSYLLILATQDTPTPPPLGGGVSPPRSDANDRWPILALLLASTRPALVEVQP